MTPLSFHRHFTTCGSTNQEGAAWIREGAPHGAVVTADTQTEGRGRRGRSWFSPPGTGLWATILLHVHLPPDRIPLIALGGALATQEALTGLGILGVSLKWPNDLMMGRRKIGGVLAELHPLPGEPRTLAAAVGIGVDLSISEGDFPEPLKEKATSIQVETGILLAPMDLLLSLHSRLLALLRCLEEGNVEALLEPFTLSLLGLHQEVQVDLPLGTLRGIAIGLGPRGELHVRDALGEVHVVWGGDVFLIEGSIS